MVENSEKVTVPKRILSSLIRSISAGVVPRLGAPYIAIGRDDEIAALLTDLNQVSEGGSAMRFLIGKYGSGKSFLMQLMRGYALERGFLTADCDLSPERRICGSKGAGIATYRELIRNLSSKTSPEGGALSGIISKWLSSLMSEVAAGGISPNDASFYNEVTKRVYEVTRELENNVGGFDFAYVITEYYRASVENDDENKSHALRWLRGEYETKTEARRDLSVNSIIDDDSWYDYIKLWAEFGRKLGYEGLVVFIDECVNLYKISNRISRENNYEKILSMFNDTLQGKAKGLDIIMGGTPQFLEDTRRGLYSYEALRSRLTDSRFGSDGYRDLMGPVIRLRRLSDNELYALITRLTKLHGQHFSWEPRVTDEDLEAFLKSSLSRAGADIMITPREIIRDYMSMLNILLQNPNLKASDVIGRIPEGKTEAEVPSVEKRPSFTLSDIEL